MSFAEAYDELDAYMVGDEEEMNAAGHVGNLEQVERLLRGIAYRRRKVAQAEALVASERERLDAYLDGVRHRYDTAYHESSLRDYHEARLADDPKGARTLAFPSGTLSARAGQPRWEFDESFIGWAQAHDPNLLRVKTDPDKAAVKSALTIADGRAVTAAGEVVVGIEVLPAEVKFSITTGDGE